MHAPAPAAGSTPPRPAFRWGRGLLHTGLALVLVVVVFAIVAAVLPVADPRRFGEGVGRFSIFVGLGALGVSALAQTGRRTAAWVVGSLLAVLVAGLVVVLVAVAPPGKTGRPLPADELVREGGVLRHPSLGFSIPDPGAGLRLEPALATRAGGPTPDHRAWVFADASADEIAIVLLAADAATSERAFTDFFHGTVEGQTNALAGAGMVADERERSIAWIDRRAHLYAILGRTIHQRIDAFGLPGGEAVVLVTAAPTGERFATLADGVSVP